MGAGWVSAPAFSHVEGLLHPHFCLSLLPLVKLGIWGSPRSRALFRVLRWHLGVGGILGAPSNPCESRELWEAPFPLPGDRVDQSSSYPGGWDMLASALSFFHLPLQHSWQLFCHTALVMPCHSSVAMTLQRPCNDTDWKTGCPSQRVSRCSRGARRRLGAGVRSDDPQVPLKREDWVLLAAKEVRV